MKYGGKKESKSKISLIRMLNFTLKGQNRKFCGIILIGCFGFVFALVIPVVFYGYLNSLYLIDEAFDVVGPKELHIEEKFSIRVEAAAPLNLKQIKNFVEHYSLCKPVQEIQILWIDGGNPVPKENIFVFAHTHSAVVYEDWTANGGGTYFKLNYNSSLPLMTDGVLLLDVDVMVSCDDLEFWHSVWRSSGAGLVGLFPRSYKFNSHTKEYSYLGPLSVWWEGKYSLMLPSGVMLHRYYLQQFSNSTHMKILKEVTEELKSHPECTDLFLPLWSIYLKAPAPIWVDIDKRIGGSKGFVPKPRESQESRSACLTKLIHILHIEAIEYSSFKSVRASAQLFW